MNLSTTLRRMVVASGLALVAAACGSGGAQGSKPTEVDFHAKSELLPGLDFDTGLLPAGSPVQASFAISAHGDATIDASAAVSGDASKPTLTGLAGTGAIGIDGAFTLEGKLKVDVSGLPSYDGPIPGLANVKIAIKGKQSFDPFTLHHGVTARADIPKTKLPSIPLPGGIPGDLALEVVEGSFVELTFSGTCAGADGDTARYDGAIARAGTLIIQPTIEIDVPLVGKQSYPIPKISADLALGSSDVTMSAKITSFGDPPAGGDAVTGTCKQGENGGGGGHGQGGSGGGAGGSAGFCGSGETFGDASEDACVNASCCDAFDACSSHGTDVQGCIACVDKGSGARCNDFLACIAPCTGAICDSGLADTDDLGTATCLGDNCCAAFESCTNFGADPQACSDCLMAGSGALCDAALNCAQQSCQ